MPAIRPYFLPATLALLLCAAVWPTLRWVEFSGGSEQLVVAAALESQRDGSWQRRLVPSMNNEPRLRKPPITTWAAIAVVSTNDARALAAGRINDDAYRWTAVKIRTVALLFAFATLLLTFELGRVLVDRDVGLIALAICGSTYFFIEENIRLTTDVTLATFVVGANVGFVHALMRGRWVGGLTFAGIALGLAFLAKGPVGLVQTIVPALIAFPFFCRSLGSHFDKHRIAIGVALGSILFFLIASPWFLHVYLSEPGAWDVWFAEVARTDDTVPKSTPASYLSFFALVGPWTIFVGLGLLTAIVELARRLLKRPPKWLRRGRSFARMHGAGLMYALVLFIVPIIIMLFFRDRKDRYLLPMLPPACILAAEALRLVVRDAKRRPIGANLAFGVHFLILLVFSVGVPIASMMLVRNEYEDPTHWLSETWGIALAMCGFVVWGTGVWITWSLKRPRQSETQVNTAGFLTATAMCLAFSANVFLVGYGNAREALTDLKPMAAVIRREVPDANLYHSIEGVPPGFLIYSGRTTQPLPETLDLSRPSVYIVRQPDAAYTQPPTMPPPWQVLTTARRDESIWWAFVRKAE